jgi:hypothetical protein
VSASVFVWYRVAADTASARAAVERLLADVAQSTGVAGRLLARVDDPATWMEVYEAVGDADAFARTLDERSSTLGVATATGCGERHVERFAPFARN